METLKEFQIQPVKSNNNFPSTKISSLEDSYQIIKQFWKEDIEIYESCFILLLNRANKTIGWAKISQGGITGTVVDIKIVMKYVIDSLASGVILAHNHPSGNLTPSQSDFNITNKLKKSLELMDTNLVDHLILTPNGEYYSFQNYGQI
jgi:DNA repair protein RadC